MCLWDDNIWGEISCYIQYYTPLYLAAELSPCSSLWISTVLAQPSTAELITCFSVTSIIQLLSKRTDQYQLNIAAQICHSVISAHSILQEAGRNSRKSFSTDASISWCTERYWVGYRTSGARESWLNSGTERDFDRAPLKSRWVVFFLWVVSCSWSVARVLKKGWSSTRERK